MRTQAHIKVIAHVMTAVAMAIGPAGNVLAQEANPVSLTLMPVQYADVKGDVSKFQAVTGMKAGSAYGIENLTVDTKLPQGIHLSFEGNTVPKENDNKGTLLLTKDNVGYFMAAYKSLRAYSDGLGGVFPFNYDTNPANYGLGQDLKKDVGWLNLEIGNKTPKEANISLSYERQTKKGDEDSLSWSSVYENATSGMSKPYKKVAPSLLSTDESTNTLTLKEKAETPGRFTLKGQQSYEFFDGQNSRTEQQYTYLGDPTASDSKIRVQNTSPQTKLLTSSIRAERWSINDQTFFSMGYIFAHTRNSEIDILRDYSAAGVWTGYSNPQNKNIYAQNIEDKNAWTGELMTELFPALTVTGKFKAEVIARRSTSQMDVDSLSSAGGTVINSFQTYYIDNASVENKISRTGETFSLRYNGIPRTSFYSDLDLEQERNWISENRTSVTVISGSDSQITLEGITNMPKLVETVGVRVTPIRSLALTSDFKYHFSGEKFNSIYNNAPTAEYTFDKLETTTAEINEKIQWKPWRWLENSLSYKMANNAYSTQFLGQDWQKSQGGERDFNYSLTLQPGDQWMFNLGYSIQLLKQSTPAAAQYSANSQTAIYVPPFTGNVYSWMLTTSYAPKDNFSVFNTLEYSRAKNANNNPSVLTGAMTYGVDNEWYDAQFGVKWSPKKNVTVEPHYGYYGFRSYQSVEAGNYSAHVFMLDVKFDF